MLGRLLISLLAGCAVAPGSEKASVMVVAVTGIDAYSETLEGIREQIPGVQVLDARDEPRIREAIRANPPALAIAVGSEAAAVLDRVAAGPLPVVRTVLLQSDLERSVERPFSSSITVEMDPLALLTELRRLFPDKTRIGVITGPAQSEVYLKTLEQAARQLGLTLRILNCPEAREVVKVFLEFHSVDFVWCLPSPQLYNSATLKPLLVASITGRLPIIGFSRQFVEAGALFGGAADFHEVGRQTAALAVHLLRHETVPAKVEAHKFRFAYNQRVARLLGVKAVATYLAPSGIEVIR